MKNEPTATAAPERDRIAFDPIHELSDDEFRRLSEFVKEQIGISLPAVKKTMLQARLQKRLRLLRMKNFREYVAYLFSPQGIEAEIGEFINVVTTNKTDFFREPHHFEFLADEAIPLLEENGLLRQHHLHAWSAASSYGHEAYTLGMVLSEYAETRPRFAWSILGTDISTRVLEHAVKGIYREEDVEVIPTRLKKKYLLRSKDPSRGMIKIVPELQQQIEFRRLNLVHSDYGINQMFEVIFCRNVIIYFDKPTQAKILAHLCQYLAPGGFLFLGHSETLNGIPLPLETVAPTIYRKNG
jgi:chemotaxis protein methyltransferase CheR